MQRQCVTRGTRGRLVRLFERSGTARVGTRYAGCISCIIDSPLTRFKVYTCLEWIIVEKQSNFKVVGRGIAFDCGNGRLLNCIIKIRLEASWLLLRLNSLHKALSKTMARHAESGRVLVNLNVSKIIAQGRELFRCHLHLYPIRLMSHRMYIVSPSMTVSLS